MCSRVAPYILTRHITTIFLLIISSTFSPATLSELRNIYKHTIIDFCSNITRFSKCYFWWYKSINVGMGWPLCQIVSSLVQISQLYQLVEYLPGIKPPYPSTKQLTFINSVNPSYFKSEILTCGKLWLLKTYLDHRAFHCVQLIVLIGFTIKPTQNSYPTNCQ